MKTLKNICSSMMVFVLLIGGFTACDNTTEDLFDSSAAERASAHRSACFDALVEAENGWIVNYFPNTGTYGGYTFIMKFNEEGYVTISPETSFDEETTTSTFRVHSGQSTVLSFDTYSAFHQMSDAEQLTVINDEFYYLDFGKGFEGDFEFTCQEINDGELIFNGLKRGTRVVFEEIQTAELSDTYLADQYTMHLLADSLADVGMFVRYGNDSIELAYNRYHVFNHYAVDHFGFYNEIVEPYYVSNDGIGFYYDIMIGDQSANQFAWNAEKKVFESDNGIEIGAGSTPRAEFTNPKGYSTYYVKMEACSYSFKEDIAVLEASMREVTVNPSLFSGVKNIRFLMNSYPTAQEYYSGSHRIDIYSEVEGDMKENAYLIGTKAVSVDQLSFNFAVNFSDGDGGYAGYSDFHNLVDNWLDDVLYTPVVFNIELEERWSYGFQYFNVVLRRSDDPDYYIVLEKYIES